MDCPGTYMYMQGYQLLGAVELSRIAIDCPRMEPLVRDIYTCRDISC